MSDECRIIRLGVEMNKIRVEFMIAGLILLLVPLGSHGSYAADASAELFAAVNSGETVKVEQLLAAGADPNVRRQSGITPLIAAALGGRADAAKLLVDKGAEVDARSDSGMTALMVAAVKGHREVAQLLLDRGADANLPDASGLTAFKMASLKQHKEVADLLRPQTVGAQDQAAPLLALKPHFVITVLFPFVFGAMALFFLVIGLRGILTKKPFLISSRWLLGLVLLGFAPALLQAVTPTPGGDGQGILTVLRWLNPLVLLAVLIFLSFSLRGYMAFGVTDASFREGLLVSLKELNLDHEETLAVLRLPKIGADLQVAVQSWIGTGQLKMRQRQFSGVLRDIANNMNEYYRNSPVSKVNLTCCIFYAVMGVFLAVFAGVFLFGFDKIV